MFLPAGSFGLLDGWFLGSEEGQFLFHLCDQCRQLLFTLRFRGSVDVSGYAFAVDLGGVASLPEVVVDLAHTAGSWLSIFAFHRLEGGGCGLPAGSCVGRWLHPGNAPVDAVSGSLAHFIADMGVDVQGRGAGHMAYDGG